MLSRVLVDGWRGCRRQLALFHVADDADDFLEDGLRLERQRDAPANRVGVGPQERSGGPADEDSLRISFGNVTAAEQRNVHRPEIARSDLSDFGSGLIARQEFDASLEDDRLHRAALSWKI